MTLEGQNVQHDRYSIIPRTLSFVLSGDQVLLLKLADTRGEWAGKLNGVGGHIEKGESAHQSARREVMEETGLKIKGLALCGTILIDTQSEIGVGLYIFVAEALGELQPSPEGEPIWVPINSLKDVPLMPDLPIILPAALEIYQERKAAFSAFYSYADDGQLTIEMGP